MSPADVDRLYTAVEQLRQEVHGYRADLNGRLRALEVAEAAREGATDQKNTTARIVFGVAGMAAAISAVMAFILDRL
jgi:hypothetical protein